MNTESQEKLSGHISGLAHPLVGKPCLYLNTVLNLCPALPYGAYKVKDNAKSEMRGKLLLSIAYFDYHSSAEESKVCVSNVSPDKLIPIDPSSRDAQRISHTILSWLVDNMLGISTQKKKQLEEVVTG